MIDMPRAHRLIGTFLDNACPHLAGGSVVSISAAEIGELLFVNAGVIEREAGQRGMQWAPEAIDEIDLMLENIAESGVFDMRISLTPIGYTELWRRWSYALVAAELERNQQTGFSIPLPADAEPAIKGAAVLVYMLGSIGRDYPHSLFPRH